MNHRKKKMEKHKEKTRDMKGTVRNPKKWSIRIPGPRGQSDDIMFEDTITGKFQKA
jgi:hypothetical protein